MAAWCCAFGETARADNFVAWQGNAAHNGLVSGARVAPPLQRAWSDRLDFQNRYVLIDGADVV